ncbi:MAG: glycosyltransferase family 4 protein [Thermoproteota archaeon]
MRYTKKIIIFHWRDILNPESGGAENLLFKIVQNLSFEGIQVIWVAPRFPNAPPISKFGRVIVYRIGNRYNIYLLIPLFYFIKWHKKFDLFVDSITGIPWFTPLYVREKKLAVIYHLGKKETFIKDLRHRVGIFGSILAALAFILEKSIPLVYRGVDILTFSKDTRDELVDIGLSPSRIHIAQEGIELSRYIKFASCQKDLIPTVVYVGRLVATKGIEHLLQATSMIVNKIPNIRLIIIGRGYLEEKLKEYSKSLGISSNVLFTGYVTEEEKISILSRAHVLVHPSLREGWATPVIEANACGTPAIGTDVPGVRNTIINGVTGYLVPYGNPKVLAEKIISIITEPEKTQKMAKMAIEFASQYDINKTIEMAIKVFKILMNEKQKP